jgi:hypothetical protein
MTAGGRTRRWAVPFAAAVLAGAAGAQAQNRGVYPLGMSALNSGVLPGAGFTYANQLLYYSRDHARDDEGRTLSVTGENCVLMDMNSLSWVSAGRILGGATFSASATIPVAKNSLTSDVEGKVSGGGGLADSYYLPVILGWSGDRFAVRAMYGFLAPTGRFEAGANDNVGSGYWTHTLSSGQTFFAGSEKRFVVSVFEMYEFHTTQEGTGIHPGENFDLDYSLMGSLPQTGHARIQLGIAGYEQRQTTAKTGPTVSSEASGERYAVNAIGLAVSSAFVSPKAAMSLRYLREFSNRSTFQGYSLQLSFSIAL